MQRKWNHSNRRMCVCAIVFLFLGIFKYLAKDICVYEEVQNVKQVYAENIKVYENVADLKLAKVNVGDVVRTNNYYSAQYGGGAKYKIVKADESDLTIPVIQLNNGLVARMIIEDDRISPQQVGAYGDGIHDDTEAIQICMESGYQVVCKENATYTLKKGITVGKADRSILEGNNATFNIEILKSYFYEENNIVELAGKGLYYGVFFYFDRDRSYECIEWSDITVNWNVMKRQDQVETYYLFKIWQTRNVSFEGVTINIKGNKLGAVQPIAIMPGNYEKIYFNDCSINNFNHGYTSSCLWFYGNCEDFKVDNCYFYSESMDEIISVISSYSHNIVFRNCQFNKYNYFCANQQYTARNNSPNIMITHIACINDKSVENQNHIVTFEECKFNSVAIETKLNDFLYTNSFGGNNTKTLFLKCDISGDFKKAFLAAEMNGSGREQITQIDDNNEFQNKLRAEFDYCTLDINTPTIASTRGVNFKIANSKVITIGALIDVQYVDSIINCWKGSFINDDIYIKDAVAVLKDISDSYLIGISVRDCNIYTYNKNGMLSVVPDIKKQKKDVSKFVMRHTTNATSYVTWKNNIINQ